MAYQETFASREAGQAPARSEGQKSPQVVSPSAPAGQVQVCVQFSGGVAVTVYFPPGVLRAAEIAQDIAERVAVPFAAWREI